jgi:uncharacterized membrane protein YdcZ (DUF606 family)
MMNRPEQARHLKPIPGWQGLPWWRKARICCSQPTFAYSLLFALVGGAFLLAAPLLDPDLAVVGAILVAVAALMFVSFWLLAFRAFHSKRPKHDDPSELNKPGG